MQGSEGEVTDVLRFTCGRRARDFIRMLGHGLDVKPDGPEAISFRYRMQECGTIEFLVSVRASREELRTLETFADLPQEQIQNVCDIRTGRTIDPSKGCQSLSNQELLLPEDPCGSQQS